MGKYASRKLLLSIGLTILVTKLLIDGHITGEVWSNFMTMNVIGYMLGNAGGAIAESMGKK